MLEAVFKTLSRLVEKFGHIIRMTQPERQATDGNKVQQRVEAQIAMAKRIEAEIDADTHPPETPHHHGSLPVKDERRL